MEKIVMRGLMIALCVLSVTSVASAINTTVVYNATTNTKLSDGTATSFTVNQGLTGQHTYVAGEVLTYTAYNVAWGSSWTSPTGNLGIGSIKLDLRVFDADDNGTLSVNGTSLGNLVGADNAWQVLTFDLKSALGTATSANFLMDPIVGIGGSMQLDYATVTASYLMPSTQPPVPPVPPQPPVVPAPAAIILGSLGTGLVGWLRRRGTV